MPRTSRVAPGECLASRRRTNAVVPFGLRLLHFHYDYDDPRRIIEGIRSVLEEVRVSLPEENVNDATELIDHAEWGEALSLICTQLYEYDVEISESTYSKIESLGQAMGMPAKEWTILNSLVR